MQLASGKQRFRLGSPTKNLINLVVTATHSVGGRSNFFTHFLKLTTYISNIQVWFSGKNRRCLHHFFHRVICRSTGWNGWWWEEYSTVGTCCQKHHLFRCPTFLHIFIFTPYLGKISNLTTIFKKMAGLKPPCFSFQRSKNWNGKQPTPSLHVWVAASFTKCNRHRKMSKIEAFFDVVEFRLIPGSVKHQCVFFTCSWKCMWL